MGTATRAASTGTLSFNPPSFSNRTKIAMIMAEYLVSPFLPFSTVGLADAAPSNAIEKRGAAATAATASGATAAWTAASRGRNQEEEAGAQAAN